MAIAKTKVAAMAVTNLEMDNKKPRGASRRLWPRVSVAAFFFPHGIRPPPRSWCSAPPPPARAVMPSRENRTPAEGVGINGTKYKLVAFVTSAALAGTAGVLFGLNNSNVSAAQFDFNQSILILVYVVLGGLGNMWGSVIAAAALTILPEALRQFADYRMLVYAIVLILVMLATNNPTLWNFIARVREERQEKKEGAKQ